jgi:branched-chain amino acid transport system permease protein
LIEYALSGIVLGGIYSLAAVALVGTYVSAGIVKQEYLSQGSQLAQNLVAAVPLGFVFLFLIFAIRGGRTESASNSVGFFSRAVPAGQDERVDTAGVLSYLRRHGGTIAVFVVVAALPAILNGYWVGLIAQGLVFGIVFLSYTLLAGEVGMISLCQISFAGIGGVVAAQLASMHGWPVLPAILTGGVAAMPVGAVIGFLTLRMGDLIVALMTFTFGLLMDNAYIARLEGRVAFEELIRRSRSIELDTAKTDLRQVGYDNFRAPKALHLRYCRER